MQSDNEPDEAVRLAAEWHSTDPDPRGKAIVPELKQRFGLTALQAIEAIRLANIIRKGMAS